MDKTKMDAKKTLAKFLHFVVKDCAAEKSRYFARDSDVGIHRSWSKVSAGVKSDYLRMSDELEKRLYDEGYSIVTTRSLAVYASARGWPEYR